MILPLNRFLASLTKQQTVEIEEASLEKFETRFIPTINDPLFLASLGLLIAIIGGVIFSLTIQKKFQAWSKSGSPILPIRSFLTIYSYLFGLAGITLLFTGVLSFLGFSITNSLIFSIVISTISGVGVWNILEGLLKQIETGKIKEIDEFL